MNKILIIAVLSFICTGCKVGPSYSPPPVEVPDRWKHESFEEIKENLSEGSSANYDELPIKIPSCFTYWWEVFDDETLSAIEMQAISLNPNLMAALDKVAEARAIAGVDRSALYPQINLNPSYSNQASLFKLFLPPGFSLPITTFPDIYRIHQLQYVMPLSLSYEIDLWGKLRKQYEAGVLGARAEEEDFQTALLILTADVATVYFKVRAFDAELDVIRSNLALLNESLKLTTSRFKNGLVSETDVLALKQQISDTDAYWYETIRQKELQINTLATLVGTPASEFCLLESPLTAPPPLIPSGIPSRILLQRPDIAAAERNMASQHALIGVAYAAFFPSFELTGTLGYSSPDIRQFLKWKSRLWAMGLNSMQPIFNGGYNIANLNLAYANYNESAHRFEQSVLSAFQEVEDALVNVEMQKKQYESYQSSSLSAERRVDLSKSRYLRGLANYLEVLDSERSKLSAESNAVISLGNRYIATIQLIKALGGAWQTFPSKLCN